ILKTLDNVAATNASVYLLEGSVAQELNDLAAAEVAYRKALKIDPNQPMVKNNLAYTLLLRGGDVKEAKLLAEQAVAEHHSISAYQDTLARIYSKQGNF